MASDNGKANGGQPNILFIQVDEMAQLAMSAYGNRIAKMPHLDALAARSVVFENAYCNYPLCSPSRASMMAGKLPFAIDQWDNGAEFRAEIPTMAHHLRRLGYSTTLCGKMHFIGPDQYHGFEERLTTDIYPSDFSWSANWDQKMRKGGGIRLRNVIDAGVCVRGLQIDYDEEVASNAVQKLYDLARDRNDRPFFLTVSFSHPHPPFVITQKYWDMYDDDEIDMPAVPPVPASEMDPFQRSNTIAAGGHLYHFTEERIRRARHAYYGMLSYVDDKIGEVFEALELSGMADNTVIVFTSDHGEMLGERGMWMKDCFYEWSVKVPLFVHYPGIAPRREKGVTSLVDLMPTFVEMGGDAGPIETGQDGDSLMPLLRDSRHAWKDEAFSDYSGVHPAPSRMLRKGDYKYWRTDGLDPVLYNVVEDPNEQHNLVGDPRYAEIEAGMRERLESSWNPKALTVRIRESQKRRVYLRAVTEQTPKYSNWAAQTVRDDSVRYVRGREAAFFAKARMRFPFVEDTPPEIIPDDPDMIP